MMPYLIHASILLIAFYIFYWILLRNETFFKLNRWILITSLILSVTLPLITIPSNWSLTAGENISFVTNQGLATPAEIIDKQSHTEIADNPITGNIESTITTVQSANNISLASLLWYFYFTMVAVFAIALLIQLITLFSKKSILESYTDGRYTIVSLPKDEAPYSFWNTIFINPSKYDKETYKQIIAHEKIHIDQSHFLDKMLVELTLIFFWFNPVVWSYRKTVSNNLEYLTDDAMLNQGTEKETYQYSLLKVSVPDFPLHIATNYNQSFLKNRILMMNTKKSSARSTWKYLLMFPLLFLSLVTLNAVHDESDNFTQESSINDNTKNSSEPLLDLDNGEEFKSKLLSYFNEDKLNVDESEIILIEILTDRIFINKDILDNKLDSRYRSLFAEYDLRSSKDQMYIVTPIIVFTGDMINENHDYDVTFGDKVLPDDEIPVTFDPDGLEAFDYERSKINFEGVDGTLLYDSKTTLTQQIRNKENTNWQWPSFQDELLNLMQKEPFIDNTNTVRLILVKGKLLSNGNKISEDHYSDYKNLFEKYDMPYKEGWCFSKHDDHIFLLDPVDELKHLRQELINKLKALGLIKSSKNPVWLKFYGPEIRLKDEIVSVDMSLDILKLLKEHNVTSVPGKEILINTGDDVRIHVGYKDNNTYIGTMELD